jgi:hypothetical protein
MSNNIIELENVLIKSTSSEDYYPLSSVVSSIKKQYSSFNISEMDYSMFNKISNKYLKMSDSGISSYFLNYEGHSVEIKEDTYGSCNLVDIAKLSSYPEFSSFLEQGDGIDPIYIIYQIIVASYSSSLLLTSNSVEELVNLESKKRGITISFDKVLSEIPVIQCSSVFIEDSTSTTVTNSNSSTEYSSDTEVEEVPREYYSKDSMTTRRPKGSFFLVDIVDPSSDTIKLVSVLSFNGDTISSIKLNMSPSSLIINGAKKINSQQTMTRWVEEHWGDEMDQLSFQGDTFSFLDFNSDGGGLCAANRINTEPYKELQHLLKIYKSNGCIIQKDFIEETEGEEARIFFNYGDPGNPYKILSHPRKGFIKKRYYIRLTWDFAEMFGFFESFDVIENETSPFKFNYSASFKSEHTKWK